LHPERAAEAAVQLLFDLIAKPARCKQAPRTIVIKPELVIGLSA
jgi:DNA-binding LacI/PurR family transcriptional regulator